MPEDCRGDEAVGGQVLEVEARQQAGQRFVDPAAPFGSGFFGQVLYERG